MKSTLFLLFFFSFLLNFDSARSAIYYVDNKFGDNTQLGAKNRPFKTISAAMKQVQPGDVVNIVSNGPNYPYTEPIIVETSGIFGSIITIQGEPNSEKPVFEGDNSGSILRCNGKQFISVKNIIFRKVLFSGLGFGKACNDIVLENLEIYDCKKNGILVTGGGKNFKILNCTISNIGNSGVAFIGSKYNRLRNTLIEGCTISNVLKNDGITLHLDELGNTVGSNHVIKNNEIRYCGEQGIDITAGHNIKVLDNLTTDNHDSGILIDHNVSDIFIYKHESRNDKLYSLIIRNSRNVSVKDSIFTGAVQNTVLKIRGCENLLVEGNHFESKAGSRDINIVDIVASDSSTTKNLIFKKNRFVVGKDNFSKGMMLRYLGLTPKAVNTVWIKNIWFNHQNEEKVFYDKYNDRYSFEVFKKIFAPTDAFLSSEENISGS